MTRTLTLAYGMCILGVLVAFMHLVDPDFVREVGNFIVWGLGGVCEASP